MKKLLIIAALLGLLSVPVAHASLWNPSSASSVGNGTQQTAAFFIDGNRTDPYTETGNILTPFKTISAALAAANAVSANYSGFTFFISPATYVDGAPDTWPSKPFIVFGNEATYVAVSGATLPGSFDIYDLTIVGNVVESDNSLTFIHQLYDGAVVGNLSIAGLATLSGMVMPLTTSTFTVQAGALSNVINSDLQANTIDQGVVNFDDDQIQGSTTNYMVLATTTGSQVLFNGATVINTGTGGGISINNGATSSPNVINSVSIVVNSSTVGSTILSGTANTVVANVNGMVNLTGTYIPPSGVVFASAYDQNKAILNGLSLGTSSVSTNLEWNDFASSTYRIGQSAVWPGCIETYQKTASTTLTYLYVDATALVVTTTKPSFCQ